MPAPRLTPIFEWASQSLAHQSGGEEFSLSKQKKRGGKPQPIHKFVIFPFHRAAPAHILNQICIIEYTICGRLSTSGLLVGHVII